MSPLPLIIIGIQLLTAIAYKPLASLLIYGLTAADRDAYSIQSAASLISSEYKAATRLAFILLLGLAFIALYRSIRGLPPTIRAATKMAIALTFTITIGSLLKGHDPVKSLSYLVYSGIPAFLIWFAAPKTTDHGAYFKTFILIQATIALSILYLPIFSFLDGAQFKLAEGFTTINNAEVNTSLPDESVNKQLYGRYAQFHNPNALGLYASIVIALGVSFAYRAKIAWSIPLAVAITAVGSILWLNSLTRGPLVFLFGMLALIYLATLRQKNMLNAAIKLTIAAIILIAALISGELIGVIGYLIPDSSNISVQGRFDGYIFGLQAITSYPILGVPPSWDWSKGDYPHFLGLSFAADYGLATGLLVMILVFAIGGRAATRALLQLKNNARNKSDLILALLLIANCWGIAISNNMAAPIIFWISLAEALRLIYCEKPAPIRSNT